MPRLSGQHMAREIGANIGREVMLARLNNGLSIRAAARLAGVSPQTHARIELGDPSVQIGTLCRVAAAGGLRVWGRAFAASAPSLRDTGQLTIAGALRDLAHPSLTVRIEVGVGEQRSIDVVCFGATEIVAIEIERLLADYQAQYRAPWRSETRWPRLISGRCASFWPCSTHAGTALSYVAMRGLSGRRFPRAPVRF